MNKTIIIVVSVLAVILGIPVVARSDKRYECSLPIEVGDYGLIVRGDFEGMKAQVVGKVSGGDRCAYSVYLRPKEQNERYYATEKYINVDVNNFLPIELPTTKSLTVDKEQE